MSFRVSENGNRRDTRGISIRSRKWQALILIILILATLTGYATNERVNWLARLSPAERGNSVIQYGSGMIRSFNYLFGNFSSMTMIENYTGPDGTKTSFTLSYSVLRITIINNTKAYEVNISDTAISPGELDREYELVWVNVSNGMVVQTYDPELGFTHGSKALGEDSTIDSFTTAPFLSLLNSSTVAEVQGSEPQSVKLGQVKFDVSAYQGLENYDTFRNWTTVVGMNPVSGIQLIVYCSFASQSGYIFSFRILSIIESGYVLLSFQHPAHHPVGN